MNTLLFISYIFLNSSLLSLKKFFPSLFHEKFLFDSFIFQSLRFSDLLQFSFILLHEYQSLLFLALNVTRKEIIGEVKKCIITNVLDVNFVLKNELRNTSVFIKNIYNCLSCLNQASFLFPYLLEVYALYKNINLVSFRLDISKHVTCRAHELYDWSVFELFVCLTILEWGH